MTKEDLVRVLADRHPIITKKDSAMLIDEVLGVGDQRFKAKSSEAMREKIDSDKTVVLVSHSLESVAELSDRVLWIEKGRMLAIGETSEVLGTYREAVRVAVADYFEKLKEESDAERLRLNRNQQMPSSSI